MTGTVMEGRADVRLIVWTPVPPMVNVIVFDPGVLFESMIACRSVCKPELAVEVTEKGAGKTSSSSLSIDARSDTRRAPRGPKADRRGRFPGPTFGNTLVVKGVIGAVLPK